MNRRVISVVATFIISGVLALSFITGAVGFFQDDFKKFVTSMVISSIMTISSIAFVIAAYYIQKKNLLDEQKMGYRSCLYDTDDLHCHSFWLTIVMTASLVVIGLVAFTVEIANTTWGFWVIVPLLLMHANAGFSICWAFFPFGHIKKFTIQYVETPAAQPEAPK